MRKLHQIQKGLSVIFLHIIIYIIPYTEVII